MDQRKFSGAGSRASNQVLSALLTPELLRQLEQLQMLAARRAKSSARGERRSRARGQSVEFADHRNYVSGDDLRYLDWNLFGRLDRLFVKLYEEERELPVRIFLDASESMTFGEVPAHGVPSKFDFARQLAAAVGHVALCGFDRVSVNVFPNSERGTRNAERGDFTQQGTRNTPAVLNALASVRGKKSSLPFLQNLAQLRAGGAADLNASLRRGAMEARQAGVAFVISDFLDPAGYEDGLGALVARGFEVTIVQVLAPEELNPTAFGDLRLVDAETGRMQEVTFGKFRLKAYRQTVDNFVQKLREFATTRGMNFFSVSAETKLDQLVLKQLREAEVWR